MDWLLLISAIVVLMFGFVVFRGSPYVPSKKADVKKALNQLYPLASSDLLVDIGSGDGLVLREAARIGARAVGYEINPILVFISRFLSYKNKDIRVIFADFWLSQLPNDTTVVYVFSATRDMKKIISKLQNETNRLEKDINVISYGSQFKGLEASKKVGAYNLYVLKPLQSTKAQV
jgi:SAM-dependent methyltransferase